MKKAALIVLVLISMGILFLTAAGSKYPNKKQVVADINKETINSPTNPSAVSKIKSKPVSVPKKFPVKLQHNSQKIPVQIIMPSIGLNSPIVEIGLTPTGSMDVPQGPSEVGWFKNGTLPGEIGSAVMDAHVFQAFRNLKSIKPGDKIFVLMSDGSKLTFAVKSALVYPLNSVPAETLFNRKDSKWLNLITCSGTWTEDRTTYTHRLIVSSELDSETR